MTNWLSNKWNLIGIYALCALLMGFILYEQLTFTQLVFVYVLIGVMALTMWVMGVGRGMFLSTMMRHEIDGFLEGYEDFKEQKKNKE